LIDSAIVECRRIEKKFSLFDTCSEIYRLNQAGIIADSELARLINNSIKVCSLTNGRYDITCEPLVRLWGFYENSFRVPKKGEIVKILKKVDYQKLRISGDTIILSGTRLDLGSLIQGYAADRVVEMLKRNKVKEALVDIGGEIFAYGRRWRIGIKDPRSATKVIDAVDLEGAIGTSGDYENFFIKDGVRFHHLFDAKTGMPSRRSISTTVIARDCITADLLSTALFIVGPDSGKAIAKDLKVDAMWVDGKQKITKTVGFND